MKRIRVWGALWGTCLVCAVLVVGAQAQQGPPAGAGMPPVTNIITTDDITAIGVDALSSNTDGIENAASGGFALASNTTGRDNTAHGRAALTFNTTGNSNTGIGAFALRRSTGTGNIAIGAFAGFSLTTGDNNIIVGTNTSPVESDTIRIGGSQTRTFIAGIRPRTTGNDDAVAVLIDSLGQLGTFSSARRFKKDIRDMGDASSGLMRLRPVTFRYKKEYANGSRPLQYGLVAEEVAEVYPDLVTHSPGGEVEAVQYRKVNMLLLNEVQKLHRQLQAQQEQIADLAAQLVRLEALEAERGSFAGLAK